MIKPSDLERFLGKVNKSGPSPDYNPELGPCWIWTGGTWQNSGYARFKVSGKEHPAHRWYYTNFVEEVPGNLVMDHLCRVRNCVNPEHLEPVTSRVNVLRGDTVVAANFYKTHCTNGHELAGDNLFVRRDGRRLCLICKRKGERRRAKTPEYREKHAAYERKRRKLEKEKHNESDLSSG